VVSKCSALDVCKTNLTDSVQPMTSFDLSHQPQLGVARHSASLGEQLNVSDSELVWWKRTRNCPFFDIGKEAIEADPKISATMC